MHAISNDTSLNEQKILFDGYRAMSVQRKLRLASLGLGRDIMVKVFKWDPEKQGY
jgi:hypothetical protein